MLVSLFHVGYMQASHYFMWPCLTLSSGLDMQVLQDMMEAGIKPNEFTALMVLQTCTFKSKGRYRVRRNTLLKQYRISIHVTSYK